MSAAAKPPAIIGQEAYTELFDAAHVVLDELRLLPSEQRPLGKFNRLQDAIDRVREAHQMFGFAWPVPGSGESQS